MSVYSGFATRQQETNYFKIVERMLKLLAKKCLASIFDRKLSKSVISMM